ncbi:kinase-like domain-containing protein [Hypoxylon rubiginosum]|uniref:Kinase-like domain-containing protein n=1 Tax=Hypoxylon rubiginosum TaxID=110542 RepID=A0ACB9ZDE7_9PEZI|nr:kinase-like domain-containing protein [Hypoxylon rubiginosum]
MAGYTPVELPYFAPEDQLPAPLPTFEELVPIMSKLMYLDIEDQIYEKDQKDRGEITEDDNLFMNDRYDFRDTVRFSKDYVVKIGLHVSSNEALSMIYLKENTSIPVPTVYAFYEQDCYRVLIMEYIEGVSLHEYIKGEHPRRSLPFYPNVDEPRDVEPRSLDAEKRDDIAAQLNAYLEEMARLPAPDQFGGIGKYHLFGGPHATAEAANRRIFQGLTGCRSPDFEDIKELYEPFVELCERELPRFCREDSAPVFTHGQFSPESVIIRDDGAAVLIHFENAGFFPRSYEYVSMDSRAYGYADDPTWEQMRSTFPVEFDTYAPKLVSLWTTVVAYVDRSDGLYLAWLRDEFDEEEAIEMYKPRDAPAWLKSLVQKYPPPAPEPPFSPILRLRSSIDDFYDL